MGSVTIIGGGGGGGPSDDLATYRSDFRVAYYDCADDGTAGLQDSEGTNHLNELGSSVATFGNTGVNGDCIGLTGNNDQFSLQSSNICPDLTQDVAVSMWLKHASTPVKNIAIFSASPTTFTNPNWFLQFASTDTNRCGFQGVTVANTHPGGDTINDDAWHHHLFILQRAVDGDSMCRCYVNGKLVATQSYTANIDLSSGAFVLGRLAGDSVIVALVDEVEIFMGVNAAPSDKVIAAMAAEY